MTKPKIPKEKVMKDKVEYVEIVEDFVGLFFNCPYCNDGMHLKVAQISFEPSKIILKKKKN